MATAIPMGIVSLKAEGAYAADKLYKKGMWVTSSGSSYAYINPIPAAGVPVTDTSHWQQIASIGGQDLVDAAVAARDAAEGYKDDAAAYAAQLAAGTASPAGTYANLAALNSGTPTAPNTSKIYLTLDDGKWCYHNGSEWVAGGVYQATALETDKTLAVSDAAADAKVTGDKVGELKSAIYKLMSPSFICRTSTLNEISPFRCVAGDKINVKTTDGTSFTVTKINFINQNGSTVAEWYSLSNQGTHRNITLPSGADIYFVQIQGGTAQDITITNTTSCYNWKDEVEELSVKYSEFYYSYSRSNNIVEVTELGTYIPFYAKSGQSITVKSRDGSNLTPHDITYYTSGKVKIDDKWLNNVARKSLTFVAPSDIGYIQINGGTAQDVIVTNDSEYIPSVLNEFSKLLETIPNYYATQIATKEAEIRGHENDCGLVGDSLIFITDTHFASDLFTSSSPTSYFNANNSFSLIKHIIKNTATRMICFGGDIVNSATDVDTMLRYMSVFSSMFEDNKYHLRYCVGNHEYFTGNDYGQTTRPTPSELYGACPKFNENNYLGKGEMCSYFFDNTVQRVRYFIVSCGRDTELTINQVKWLLNEFTQVPRGYKIIVIGHAFLSDNLSTLRGYHANICGALDAINAGTSYTFSNTTYDYSGLTDVEVVCVITGHTHMDGSLTTTGGIPVICTTTDAYSMQLDIEEGSIVEDPRTKGTTDEQAFDVFQFDFTGKKIYATRIGYGDDRTFTYGS